MLGIKTNLSRKFLVIKIIIWFLPVLLFFWIVYMHFVPSGKFHITYQSGEASNYVENFALKEKDFIIGSSKDNDNIKYQLITTSPIYFDVTVPRPFASAKVSLLYRNPDLQPSIRLGVKQSNDAYYYRFLALNNPILDSLPEYWIKSTTTNSNLVLWQKDQSYKEEKEAKENDFNLKKAALGAWRDESLVNLENRKNIASSDGLTEDENNSFDAEKRQIQNEYFEKLQLLEKDLRTEKSDNLRYASVEDFLKNFPSPQEVIEYNYDLASFYEMPGYQKSSETTVIDKALRGPHEIYTYIGKDEDLDYIFTIQDINRHAGEDIFKIIVYDSKGNIINEVTAPDDGEINASGKIFTERRHQLLMKDLPFGFYKLVIDLPDDDIFIKRIETKQHLIMFKNNLYLADNVEYSDLLGDKNITPTTFYSNCFSVKIRTPHQSGFQTIRVNNYPISLDLQHQFYELSTNNINELVPIYSPKNDIFIEGDCYFVFSEEQYFDPNFNIVASIDQVNNVDDYNFIIADYPQPTETSNYLIGTTAVSIPQLYVDQGDDLLQYHFIITAPGLAENKRTLQVVGLDITFERNPIDLESIINKLRSLFGNFN